MTEQLELVAESLARRTDSRRTFIGRLAKAGFVAFAGLAAGIPSSMLVEAGSCSFPHGACTNCPADGCPAGCSPDHTFHGAGYCWAVSNPSAVCCDCSCPEGPCGCRSHGARAA